ncbi:RidA family protein [Jiangella mangrovi]|uniref:Enamine deaminase RidA (YjgF/YER057c/UK114 family) n=1 Tax=Jiangella mangrovi TaxID=1524084 RepID=A0A7W9GLB3_9ACTN|nr:RidA family protein [Jiangella mangrovi]MBB5785974.1 enamine deaminase RidA (YjgF/YER057c/UK114 family) [Jiangella mangrovi]
MTHITHINPESMHSNPAFSQVVRVPAGSDLVFVGGQNGVDASGQVVGPDLASQTRQAVKNLLTCLDAAGAQPEDVVKWTILIQAGESVQEGFAAFGEVWGQRPNPPAITAAFVAALGVPGALVEIEAVAAVG